MRRQPPLILTAPLAVLLALAFLPHAAAQPLGKSDPSFRQPSRAPGVDYVVPTEAGIKAALDRVRDHFIRATPYRVIDTTTSQPIADFSTPIKAAGIDDRENQFNAWDYSMGVVLAAMLLDSQVTGDATYRDYTFRNFAFIFDHLEYFRKQAELFGPQPHGYPRLLNFKELDDCGAIGAALVKAYAEQPDPRYRPVIDRIAEHIAHKQLRLADGTLARPRPQPLSLWIDDIYMSVPFLAQMGKLTGERKYFDDAARQAIGVSAHLQDPATGLFHHSWFESNPYGVNFYWGRGCGWALMATAELLSVLPEDHPDRERVLAIFRRAAQGVAEVQSGTGMWRQLLDRVDSYPETSATAMFTFAIARGVNRGWLSPVYAPVAQAGWQAIEPRIRADGKIEGICVSTTAAYDAVYYYNRPTDLGATQGYGPVLMAGAEVIAMLRGFDIDRNLNTFHYRRKP